MTETRNTSAYFTDVQYFEALINILKERVNKGLPIWGEKITRSTSEDCSIQNTLTDHKLARKYDKWTKGR
jgi:predicted DNA-binding protein (UPF0278 family)